MHLSLQSLITNGSFIMITQDKYKQIMQREGTGEVLLFYLLQLCRFW